MSQNIAIGVMYQILAKYQKWAKLQKWKYVGMVGKWKRYDKDGELKIYIIGNMVFVLRLSKTFSLIYTNTKNHSINFFI